MRHITLLIGLLLWLACSRQQKESFFIEVPEHIPQPTNPDNNPLTAKKVELGKMLFFDNRLSLDYSVSCASCHIPEFAFADTARVSRGFKGKVGFRNSPSLLNVVFQTSFFRDGGVKTLERVIHPPVLTEFEMNMHIDTLMTRLLEDHEWVKLFKNVWNRPPDYKGIVEALAAYQRTLIDFNTPYDKFLAGDSTALSPQQQRGLTLFRSKRLNCTTCHREPLLMDNSWHNIGLYQVYADHGRGRVSLDSADFGKFRTPMLRYVSKTAPYMHDGSILTLEDVLNFYASGGENHQNKSVEIKSFSLTPEEKKELLAFLEALGK